MTGGQPRTHDITDDYVEVYCWCGRVKGHASMPDIRAGVPYYCGPRCSTLKPLSYTPPRGRPKLYDSNGNKLNPDGTRATAT